MIPSLLTRKDYYKLGLDLGYMHKEAYINFMLKRFPNCKCRDYAAEWATRFLKGIHWACADSESKLILKEVYKVDE